MWCCGDVVMWCWGVLVTARGNDVLSQKLKISKNSYSTDNTLLMAS